MSTTIANATAGASAAAFPEPPALTPELLTGVSHLHVANPYALPNLRRHAGELLRRSREARLTTSLDAGWDSRGEWMNVLAPCLPYLDVLFVNDNEALRLTGAPDFEAAAGSLRLAGVPCVAVKLGARGCAIFTSSGTLHQPAFRIEVADTTGAGDLEALRNEGKNGGGWSTLENDSDLPN